MIRIILRATRTLSAHDRRHGVFRSLSSIMQDQRALWFTALNVIQLPKDHHRPAIMPGRRATDSNRLPGNSSPEPASRAIMNGVALTFFNASGPPFNIKTPTAQRKDPHFKTLRARAIPLFLSSLRVLATLAQHIAKASFRPFLQLFHKLF